MTPLFTQFSPEKITVDLLDINETSLLSAKKVIQSLGYNKFIDQAYLADAATFKCQKDYDIVISETLQSALRAEPFVAIYQNLVPQLSRSCLFIPEEVDVSLIGETKGQWDSEKLCKKNTQQQNFGSLLAINKYTANEELITKELDIENQLEEKLDLKLHTTVQVMGNIVLKEGDCSLNIPLKIMELEINSTIHIEYYYKQEYPAEINLSIRKTSLTNPIN